MGAESKVKPQFKLTIKFVALPMKRSFLVIGLILLNALPPALAQRLSGGKKPNILFILTDDQGWPTLGSYGNQRVPTPHLDALAREGVRFTDAYVMPQCTPTRAALLSGQHTARNGMWHVLPWYGSPWARVAEPMFRETVPARGVQPAERFTRSGLRDGHGGQVAPDDQRGR